MTNALTFSARLFALIVATISGITFLAWSGLLLWLSYKMPGLIARGDILTISALGISFCCSGSVYMFLVRRSRRIGEQN